MIYLSIFVVSFLAATVLPASSELTLAALLNTKDYNSLALLLSASLGNILGSVLNWFLGYYSLKYLINKWFFLKKTKLTKPQIGSKNLVSGLYCLRGYLLLVIP